MVQVDGYYAYRDGLPATMATEEAGPTPSPTLQYPGENTPPAEAESLSLLLFYIQDVYPACGPQYSPAEPHFLFYGAVSVPRWVLRDTQK